MTKHENIYMIGIGGIGMSGLARYFNNAGKKVAGYDRSQTELCEKLESEGISIHYEDNINLIPDKFKKKDTLVIYTPAIPEEHQELNHLKKQGYELVKRARVLGDIAQNHTCLAVAGTHGKTTTSCLLAHLFRQANVDVTAFLGGLSTNYQTNFWGNDENEILVAEADEFDRSFLNLKPAGAIITSTDADHLDIYGNAEELKNTFQQFAASVNGTLLIREGLEIEGGLRYGFSPQADYRATDIRVEEHSFVFDLQTPVETLTGIRSPMPGNHNVENALAAAALALHYGLKPDQIKNGIETFKGVTRRFEYHIKTNKMVFIDDYAHHPKEINALAESVKMLYPGVKKVAIFQPHLFSRTRDFMAGFAEALSQFDEVILMDIYPARERPLSGITSNSLLDQIDVAKKAVLGRQEILTRFKTERPEVILTIGAGDIDQLVKPLKLALLQ